MRYSSDHKARTRERIVHAAAAAIRSRGIDGVSLSDIMSDVDLTNGGFYAHFKSKDDLIAKAIGYMFDERYGNFMDKAGASNAKQALAAFIDYYLSTAHLKAPERGCPIPALASDVAHMHKAARGSFSVGVTRLIEALTALFERAGVRNPRLQASATLAQLVGTLNLVRTIQEPARAQEMLDDLRDALREHLDLNS